MLRVAVARISGAAPAGDMPGWLGEGERRRWAVLAPGAHPAFAASRRLLRALLQSATGVPEADWDVSAQPGAAPVARARTAGKVHVSLAHRLGWVAAAVSDAPVGVDVECERAPRSEASERAALMLSATELVAWQRLPPAAREAALLTSWTAKEAWFKAGPPGSPWDFRRIDVRACVSAYAGANVRTWSSPPVHLALCCLDARALAEARCDLPGAIDSSWHVQRATSAN